MNTATLELRPHAPWHIRARLAAALLALAAAAHAPPAAAQALEVTLHPERERQTIRGFGASDA